MPRYKTIPSALHNFAESFFSAMNYVGGDHLVEHLTRSARGAGTSEVVIDWHRSDVDMVRVEPLSVVTAPVAEAIGQYRAELPELLGRMDSSLRLLHTVRMRLRFDWGLPRPYGPIICTMEAEADLGRTYDVDVRVMQPLWSDGVA